MSNDIAFLTRKTLGFIQAIEKMGTDARKKYLTAMIANDYNRLRQLIEERAPVLKEYLPPSLTVTRSNPQSTIDHTFFELLVLTEQIYQLLQGLADTSDAEHGNE